MCPYSEAVSGGAYKNVPYAETPCARCELDESSIRTIEFDEDRGVKKKNGRSAGGCGVGGRPHFLCEVMPVDVMQEVVAAVLTLPADVRDTVCWKFAGFSYRDIGLAQGVTAAAVEVRLKRAMARWPILRELFPVKAAKQLTRKVHIRKEAA